MRRALAHSVGEARMVVHGHVDVVAQLVQLEMQLDTGSRGHRPSSTLPSMSMRTTSSGVNSSQRRNQGFV